MHPGVLLAIGGAVLLFLCLLFWPRWGLVSFWRNIHLNTRRTRIEHALKHLFNNEYMQHRTTADTLSVKLSISRRKAEGLLSRMEARGLVKKVEGGYRLTEDGSAYALRIVRAHRLWERYLADETGLRGDEWHRKANAWSIPLHPRNWKLWPSSWAILCTIRMERPFHPRTV